MQNGNSFNKTECRIRVTSTPPKFRAVYFWHVFVLSSDISVVTAGPQGEKGRDGLPGKEGK